MIWVSLSIVYINDSNKNVVSFLKGFSVYKAFKGKRLIRSQTIRFHTITHQINYQMYNYPFYVHSKIIRFDEADAKSKTKESAISMREEKLFFDILFI